MSYNNELHSERLTKLYQQRQMERNKLKAKAERSAVTALRKLGKKRANVEVSMHYYCIMSC